MMPSSDDPLASWMDLGEAARRQRAREVIERFDADFDARGRRVEALGALDILLAGVPTAALDLSTRALTVGRAWCRIVHADVEYDLLHGLEVIEESREAAERLRRDLEERVGLEVGLDDEGWFVFAAYAAARWHDGAGRIDFRCGDMQGARQRFDAAVDLVKKAGDRLERIRAGSSAALLRCRGDMRSNLARAEFDADKQVGGSPRNEALREKYVDYIKEERRSVAALARGILDQVEAGRTDAAAWWGAGTEGGLTFPRASLLPASVGFELRERLRGLCNLEHNLSIVHLNVSKTFKEAAEKEAKLGNAAEADRNTRIASDELASSHTHSRQSAVIACATADEYRFAQALRHMAQITPATLSLRETLSRRVESLGWRRGRWMAKQHRAEHHRELAKLHKDRNEHDREREEQDRAQGLLLELIEEFRRTHRRRGRDLGTDVDVWQYTVRDYRESGAPFEKAEPEELAAARSMRRAIKAPMYRRRFRDNVLPLYQAAIDRLTDLARSAKRTPEGTEELLGLVDETMARELLDLLAGRGGDVSKGSSEKRSRSAEEPFRSQSRDRPPSESTRSALASRYGSAPAKLVEKVKADRERFERDELHRRMSTSELDPEVIPALRRLTAKPGGPTVFRYFTYAVVKGKPGIRDDARYAVVVVHGGRLSGVIPLTATLKEIVDEARSGKVPSRARATWLWERFLAAPWAEAQAMSPREAKGRVEELVIIPAPGMFALPLHVALVPSGAQSTTSADDAPLCTVLPLCFSVSATSFVTRRRYLLHTQTFDHQDDLVALVPTYEGSRNFHPGELVDINWASSHFHLAGRAPQGVVVGAEPASKVEGTLDGLKEVLNHRAEVFVFAGHGAAAYLDNKDVEVALELDNGDYLTQYAVLEDGFRLRHNKWTLINACVSGTGSDDASLAEVQGFLKAFIAAGAGALTVTLWPVRNDQVVEVARQLLRRAGEEAAKPEGGPVNIVEELREIQWNAYRDELNMHRPTQSPSAAPSRDVEREIEAADHGHAPWPAFHACPLVLYL